MKWFTILNSRNGNAKERKMCENAGCYQRISPSAKSKGKKMCATCVRRSGKGRRRFNKD